MCCSGNCLRIAKPWICPALRILPPTTRNVIRHIQQLLVWRNINSDQIYFEQINREIQCFSAFLGKISYQTTRWFWQFPISPTWAHQLFARQREHYANDLSHCVSYARPFQNPQLSCSLGVKVLLLLLVVVVLLFLCYRYWHRNEIKWEFAIVDNQWIVGMAVKVFPYFEWISAWSMVRQCSLISWLLAT